MTTHKPFTMLAFLLAAASVQPALAGESLAAFAARHFNTGVSVADQMTVPGGTSATTKATRSTAAGPSLTEAAAIHFNRGVAIQDRQPVEKAAGRANPALEAFAIEHFDRGVAVQDRQAY
jgi:hypothetical protein